jgi:hypothetical protein
VQLTDVKEFWNGAQPDFWGNAEQSAECWQTGGNDWNDLDGSNQNRYVVCKAWCEWHR